MKKLNTTKLMLVCLLALQNPFSVLASAEAWTKKNCWFNQRKYNIEVHACDKLTNYCQQGSDRACTYNISMSKSVNSGYARVAYAKAWSGPGGTGRESRAGFNMSSGFLPKYRVIPEFLNDMSLKSNSINHSDTTISNPYAWGRDTTSLIEYDSINRKIIIRNYFAQLELYSNDLNSFFVNIQIKAFEASSDPEGDGLTGANIFHTISIYLQGNTLTLSNINSNQFSSSSSSDKITYTYIGGDIIIDVPATIAFERVGCYGSIETSSVDEEIAPLGINSQNSGFILKNIFPNPLDNNLNINLFTSNPTSFSLLVYDLNGKVVYTDSKKYLTVTGDNILSFDLSVLKPNSYFVILRTDEREYRYKIIKL